MIQRTCQACGADFDASATGGDVHFTFDGRYCPDCSAVPVPMLAEVFGQIPAPAVSYRG